MKTAIRILLASLFCLAFPAMGSDFGPGGIGPGRGGGGGGADDQTAAEVPFTPSGGITETNTQGAVVGLETRKVNASDVVPYSPCPGGPVDGTTACQAAGDICRDSSPARPMLWLCKTPSNNYPTVPAGSDWEPLESGGPADLCVARTVKGGGYHAATDTYAWTCGQYPWSAETGGVSGTPPVASYNTPTTTGGNTEVIDCTGEGAGTSRLTTQAVTGDYASSCLIAGEVVYLNAMADAVLAEDHTRYGGQIYFPEGVYVDRGCGDKSNGTNNNCPVLRAPQDTRVIRQFTVWGGRQFIGAGADRDGLANGRSGTAFVSNTGGRGANGGPTGTDPNGDGTALDGWTFAAGVLPSTQNVCVPVAIDNPVCAVQTTSGTTRPTNNPWGSLPSVYQTADISHPSNICVNDEIRVAQVGLCRADRRIICTTDNTQCTGAGVPYACCTEGTGQGTCNARASTTTGGCDFGAGGNKGPCESTYDSIAYDYALPGDYQLEAYTKSPKFGVATNQPQTDPFVSTVAQTPGTACGGADVSMCASPGVPYACCSGLTAGTCTNLGKTVQLGATKNQYRLGWNFPAPVFQQEGKPYYLYPVSRVINGVNSLVDWDNVGGGYVNIGFSPNDWYSRDSSQGSVCGQAANASCDCLSGGPTGGTYEASASSDAVDDEVVCDSSEILGLHAGWGGGFDRVSVFNGSTTTNAVVDGSPMGYDVHLYDSLVADNKRGSLADASSWHCARNVWRNNYSENTALALAFTSGGLFDRETYLGNYASTLMYIQNGRGITMRNSQFIGNHSASYELIRLSTSQGVYFEDNVFRGNYGTNGTGASLFSIAPIDGQTLAGITIKNTRVEAGGLLGGAWGKAAILFHRFNNDLAFDTGRLRDIIVDGLYIESNRSYECAVGFVDFADGATAYLVNDRPQVTLRDVSINSWDNASGATTGQKAVCMLPEAANGQDASNDTGVLAERYIPRMEHIVANGLAQPEFRHTQTTAASTGDCGALSSGVSVSIYDDTAVGACADAGADGILDGGGTAASVCVCDPAGDSADGVWAKY